MFKEIINKLSTLASHHQAITALIIAVSAVMISWGFEKILEIYFFPKRPLAGYVIAIAIGLLLLWLTQHFILHVI